MPTFVSMKTIFSFLFILYASYGLAQIRVLVIGTSEDAGLVPAPEVYAADSAWPKKMERMMDGAFSVTNAARTNTSYINRGVLPIWVYWNSVLLKTAKPKLVIIGGPTNDARVNYAPYDHEFDRYYDSLIVSVKERYNGPKVVLCTAIKSLHNQFPQRRVDSVNAKVMRAAERWRLEIIRMDTLPTSILGPDKLHCNHAGYTQMALVAKKHFSGIQTTLPVVIHPPKSEPAPSVISTMPTPIPGVLLKIEGEKRSLILKYDKSY